MRDIFGFNTFVSGEAKETLPHQLLEHLTENGRILIPAFSTHHAMLAEIESLPDGRYTLRIFNSGEGLGKNHSAAPDGRKKAAFVEYSFDSLDDAHLAELLDLGARVDPQKYSKSQDIYDWAAKLPGAEKVNVPAGEMTWQTPQKSGDCTLEVVNAFLRDNMKRAVAKDPALQDRGDLFARQVYLEMKAAYLDQCRADYLQQKGGSKESALLLELLKVRADRAHVSAGFSGGNGLRAGAGVIRAIKGYLRLSSQLQDLATSGLKKGSFWHINQQVEVSAAPSNSGDDVVTFKEHGPRNRTFQVNKTTGAVTIEDPEFKNFHMQLEPRFDANHRLVSISVSEGIDGKVEKQRTYFQLDTSEVAANPGLPKYLNQADIEKLSKVKGSLYLSIEDLGSGHFDLKGFLYDASMSSATKLGKSTLGEKLSISTPMRAEGAHLAAGDSESRPGMPVIDDLATPVQPGTSDPQNAARPTSTVVNSSLAEIEDEIHSLWQTRRLVTQLSPEGNTRTTRITHDDGSISYAQYRDLGDGRFMVTKWTLAEDGKSLTYNCRTLGPKTIVTVDEGRVDLTDVNRDSVVDALKAAKPGEVVEAVHPTSWHKKRVEPGDADHEYLVTETAKDENGTPKIVTTHARKQPAVDAAASANTQVSSEVRMPPEDAALLSLDPQGEPIEVVEITTQTPGPDGQLVNEVQTQYLQDRPDGSSRALVRTQMQTGEQSGPADSLVEWRSQDLSSDGKSVSEVSRVAGSDARSERTATVLSDGSLQETLLEQADPATVLNPDEAVVRTLRTTARSEDGSTTTTQEVQAGDTVANASPGGHASRSEQIQSVSQKETGADGVVRTRTRSSGRTLRNGLLTNSNTETVVARRGTADVVESLVSDITTPSNVTLRSETRNGQTTELVKVGDNFVEPKQASDTPELRAALAMQDLGMSTVVADLASQHGLEAVAPLLGDTTQLSSDTQERSTQLQELLTQRAARSTTRVYASGALAAGGGAMALYQGVLGAFALRDGLKAGDNYLIGMGATGLAAGGAQVAELGLQGASLMASSSRALATLSKVGSVAGKLALGLGVVAMGMSIPGLVNAIKRGDTKAIVSNSVGLGGGLAAMVVAGATAGSLIGAAVGLLIGGLVIGFVELFNKLFRPGTPIQGADPLLALPQAERTQALQAAQTLLSNWDGSSLSEDRLKELSASGPNEAIKAAAQFFVDHPTLRQWMDAANAAGGNLEKRDARFDGHISKSDLVRYIGYMAVPPEIYQTLPAPSLDARLWAVGIIDLQTHEQVVDEFGKDGEGQGSGDGAAGLPEYANIASGAFDERTRELLQQRYAGESDEQITQHLTLLKKACAYLAAYPSELRALDSFKKPGQEDGKVGTVDLEMMRQANQTRINELWAAYPNGLPSFNDNAQAHTALGANNPALWRPDRFDNPNPDRPQSYYQVMLDQFDAIDANLDGQLDWAEMANAREQALQQQQYGLYYALDYIMRNGADLFQDRGEGTRLQLSKADLALKAAQDKLSATPQQEQAYWALLQQHFDEIELLECPTNPADGQASLGDLKAAQQKYLEQGNWDGYYAVGWVLSHYNDYSDAINNLSKDTVMAQAAKSLLIQVQDQVDEADGSPDGKLSLTGLDAVQATYAQNGQTQEAAYMALLAQDYRARSQRLGTSLDADESMRRDSTPEDGLISIEGDVRKQLNEYELSEDDKQALQNFLDNSGQIPHYGEDGDVVSEQEFKQLLGQNLQWFGSAH